MKFKYIILVYIVTFLIALSIGIYSKSFYRDFNEENKPLNNFSVGLMTDHLVKIGINTMKEELENSKIILAVECKEKSYFKYSCATQKVEVKKIFKGNNICVGDNIEICTVTDIFMDKEMYVDNKPCINIDFVNEMQVGKKYLVFLDKKVDNSNIFVKSDEFLIKPVFSYEQIKNKSCKAFTKEQNSSPYKTVADNEFFVTSQKGIDRIEKYKSYLIEKYSY